MTDRTVRTLVAGRGLVEAPRWHDGRLHFSDWSAGEVLTLTPEGGTQVIARADAFPLCTDRLPDGRLLLVAGTQLLVQAADGLAPEPYADLAPAGDQVWNDIVVDRRGNAYVNGGGGFEGGDNAVALVTPDGVVRQVAQELAFPNGMAVTPDGGTLLVADSYAQEIVAFGIAPDGGLSGRRTWAAVPEHPDGICLDAEGAVWFADVGTSRCVRVAEGGRLLDEVPLDRGCFACVLGGPDRTTLYITAAEWLGWEEGVTAGSGILAAVDVGVSGAGYP
ncbi:SMP-30/gluconolactonase/LRE family protein [Promicromonospora sp. NPDC057138]|uniref:SMP-30/gluconolactonase/LRE family protein n=1 Tax=Promicromonospora sp. NPDC057138 TaxID=3346031 RepID=UPI0036325514